MFCTVIIGFPELIDSVALTPGSRYQYDCLTAIVLPYLHTCPKSLPSQGRRTPRKQTGSAEPAPACSALRRSKQLPWRRPLPAVPEVGAAERAKKAIEGARDGAVVLLHDLEGNDATVEALDTIIPELKRQGYEFVTITELFKRAGINYSNAKKEVYSYTDQ